MNPQATSIDLSGSGVVVGLGGVVGLGTDITHVEDLRRALGRRPGLRRRLFSDAEWAYSARHRDPLPHLAARFAAKEAVMKCLRSGIGAVAFTDIEVVHDDSGAPTVSLRGRAADRAGELDVGRWWLSLSHSRSLAQAVALAVGPPGSVEPAGADSAVGERRR